MPGNCAFSLKGDLMQLLLLLGCYSRKHLYINSLCLLIPAEAPKITCFPNPCGPNSKCREVNGRPTCSCLPNYLDAPPHCRPECSVNSDCANHMACIGQKCTSVCDDVCGENADCRAHRHVAMCTCRSGYTGDAYSYCAPVPRE